MAWTRETVRLNGVAISADVKRDGEVRLEFVPPADRLLQPVTGPVDLDGAAYDLVAFRDRGGTWCLTLRPVSARPAVPVLGAPRRFGAAAEDGAGAHGVRAERPRRRKS